MAEDDAIMKMRLLIDGDGMGDDRKINTLIRQIVKFASSSADETPEDVRFDKRFTYSAFENHYSLFEPLNKYVTKCKSFLKSANAFKQS